MKWSEVGRRRCSVARALSIVGDRWTMLVVREAFLGTRRFDQFLNHVGASRNIVADRLRKLVGAGVLDKRPYEERPRRFEYRLTDKGRDLYPVLVSLLAWGDRWMAEPEEPRLELVHARCGQRVTPGLSCPCCGEPIDPKEMQVGDDIPR